MIIHTKLTIMAANSPSLSVLRSLIRELRRVNGQGQSIRSHPMYVYVMEQYRRYQVTDQKYCRGEKEVTHMANTYSCLLESVRRCEEICAIYNRGEKTTEEAANIVGLRLPKTHED